MPTIRQLQYFVAVAETLHFRLAAESCNVTQPTLSMQLRALERRLGVKLIERNRHSVRITQVGREIEKHARSVLREVREIGDLAERGRAALGGFQKVGGLPTLSPYLMPHILPHLRQKYPDLKLFMREDIKPNLEKSLAVGELDMIMVPQPLRGKDLDFVDLFVEPLWLAVSARHRLAGQSKLEDGDLAGETVLLLEPGHRLHDQVLELCDAYGAYPHSDFEGTSLDTLRQMVGMEMGATFLPALYVRAEAFDDDQIAVLPFNAALASRRIAMVWRRSASRRHEYLELAAFLRNLIRDAVPEVLVDSY